MERISRGKMTNNSPKPTGNAPRTLSYRGQIRWFGSFCLWTGILACVAAVSVGLITHAILTSLHVTGHEELVQIFSAILATPGLLLLAQYFYLFRPLADTQIQAHHDGLLIVRKGTPPIQVRFADVVEIKQRLVGNYGGEIVLVMASGKRHRFNIFLERIEYIVDALVAFNPTLLSREKHIKLTRRLVLGDHWLARFQEAYRGGRKWLTFFRLFILPALAIAAICFRQSTYLVVHVKAYYYGQLAVLALAAAIILDIFFQLLSTHVINSHMASLLEENPKNKRRDLRFESTVQGAILPLYTLAVAAVLFGVYTFDLNTVGFVLSSQDAPSAGILKNERLWLDRRFNCVTCRFALSIGTVVKFDPENTYDRLGVIVALPGETTQVSRIEKGRYLEVGSERTLAGDQVAIQWDAPEPRTEIVSLALVHGRVSRKFIHSHRGAVPVVSFETQIRIPAPTPRFSPEQLSNCPPEQLLEIKKELVYSVTTAVEAYGIKSFDVCAQTLETSAQTLTQRIMGCDATKARLKADLDIARGMRDAQSRAWYMMRSLQGFLPALDEQTRAIASPSAPAQLPTQTPSTSAIASPEPTPTDQSTGNPSQ